MNHFTWHKDSSSPNKIIVMTDEPKAEQIPFQVVNLCSKNYCLHFLNTTEPEVSFIGTMLVCLPPPRRPHARSSKSSSGNHICCHAGSSDADLTGKQTIIVSGHHGKLHIDGLYEGGGYEDNPIAAIVFPSKILIRSTEKAGTTSQS